MPSLSLPYEPAIGPLIHVSFTQAGALSGSRQGGSVPAKFLIDTGASITALSPAIAKRVGLRSLGRMPVSVPAGLTSLNAYLVDLLVIFGDPLTGFPHGRIPTFPVQNLPVLEYLGRPDHYQGLLGRDILDRGILKTDGPNKKYILTLPDLEHGQSISITNVRRVSE